MMNSVIGNNGMATVRELIEALSQFSDDDKVYVVGGEGQYGSCEPYGLLEVRTKEDEYFKILEY